MKLFNRKEFLNEGKFDKLFGAKVYESNIDVSHRHLDTLKELDYYVEVKGYFNCSNNNLDSLEGGPTKVGYEYSCNENTLIKLEYCASYVGGDFNCSNNELDNLIDGPIEVGGHYECSENQIDSLEGAPKEVNGKFLCAGNPKVTKEMVDKLLETSNIKGKVITAFGIFKSKK